MPRGDKSAYTAKQKRMAEHIEESELERGATQEAAERIGWATVNKIDGGGKLSGSGRKPDGTAAKAQTTKKAAPNAKAAAGKAAKSPSAPK